MELVETCVALAMLYALLSVVASALKEALEVMAQRRKKNFKAAIEELLGFDGAKSFLEHPRIRPITSKIGDVDSTHSRHWPTYIDPATFSAVVMDIVQKKANSQLAKALQWANGAADAQIALAEKIYAERMERLTGSFKRNAQGWLLGLGLVLAVIVDADTVQMARQLTTDAPARAALVKLAENTTNAAAVEALCGKLKPLEPSSSNELAKPSALLECVRLQTPEVLGWSDRKLQAAQSMGLLGWIGKLIGYALTAIAISLGAAFWFDLIGKVANIRATNKPKGA
jgi:hypothetical protein